MSRSYKKGFQCAGDKEFKKIYNRKLRRSQIDNELLPQGGSFKKMNQPWEISDYKGSITWEEYRDLYPDITENELWAHYCKLYRSK